MTPGAIIKVIEHLAVRYVCMSLSIRVALLSFKMRGALISAAAHLVVVAKQR